MPRSRSATHAPMLLPGTLPAPVLPPAACAGIDEAGRGCLAGPVVAAAVILPEHYDLPGLADSKTLSARQREQLAPRIRRHALAWGLGMVWPRRIDAINILQATFEAMSRAVATLGPHCGQGRQAPEALHLLVDGNKTIPPQVLRHALAGRRQLPAQRAVVDGDRLIPAISAASILAKTCRDQLMTVLDRRWPGYDLARHKGYGTAAHYAALRRLGPCPLHRLTFRGVCADTPDAAPAACQGELL